MAETENIYINPRFPPYIDDKFNGTWFIIEARELIEETAYAKGQDGGLKIGDEVLQDWKFLAPISIQENLVHEWVPWETIASRLAGIGKEYSQLKNNVSGIYRSFEKGINEGSVGSAWRGLSSLSKSKTKVDTPLVYENSQRREWTFTFNLITDEDSQSEIYAPVIELELYSSPKKVNDGIDIELPSVFDIRTEAPESDFNTGFIYAEHTALTSIQPTYMAPYDKNGYPMRCELTLTFKELPPLYQDSINVSF